MPTIDPYSVLQSRLPPIAWLIAQRDDVALYFNGFWDQNGVPQIISGVTAGSWSFSLTVGVGGGANVNDCFSFEIAIVSVKPGEALVVLKWVDSRSNGTSLSGMEPLFRIKQGLSQPIGFSCGAGGGSASGQMFAPLSDGLGSGHWGYQLVMWSYGYMGDDGRYYCIGVNEYIPIWIPDGAGSRDRITR